MINFSKEQMYNTINTIANEELNLETARKNQHCFKNN